MSTDTSLWFLLSAFFLVIFLYPYLIYPFVLRLAPKRPISRTSDNCSQLSATLLFCAYNEEQVLPAKIANVRALKERCPDLEILAYSDGSTDATEELLLQNSDIITMVSGKERVGKTFGLRILVSMCTSDVLIFTDANVFIDPDGLPRLIQCFQDSTVGCVAGSLIYVDDDDLTNVTATARVGSLYWRLEEHIKQMESQTGSTMGADGAIFARRRMGYPYFPEYLLDDLTASISVIFDGLRCISVSDVVAYERSVALSKEEFRRKRRIACQAFSTYRYLLPQLRALPRLDRFKFYSHKLIRWWGASLLLAAVICFSGGAYVAGYAWLTLTVLCGGTIIVWLLGAVGIRVFLMLREVLLAVIATNIGILESLLGSHYQIWSPAKTR